MAVDEPISFPSVQEGISNGLNQHSIGIALSAGDSNLKQMVEGVDEDGEELSNESDSENDDAPQSQNVSQKRRAQNAKFASWFAKSLFCLYYQLKMM